ncbi:hypothetical protein [Clostridium tertium]
MIINNLKDLQIMKNALQNYITNGEKALEEGEKDNISQFIMDIINDGVIGAKRLLEDVDKEFMGSAYKKAKDLIDKGEVHEFTVNEIEDILEQKNKCN